jgi:hypothetical protein
VAVGRCGGLVLGWYGAPIAAPDRSGCGAWRFRPRVGKTREPLGLAAHGDPKSLESAHAAEESEDRRKPVFPAVPRALQWVRPLRGCLHGWCRPWSSKPVGGVNNAPSGFDSHTLPLAPPTHGGSRPCGTRSPPERPFEAFRRASGVSADRSAVAPALVRFSLTWSVPGPRLGISGGISRHIRHPAGPPPLNRRPFRPSPRHAADADAGYGGAVEGRAGPHGQPSPTPERPTAAAARFQAACWAGVMRRAAADSITRVHSATSGMSSQEARATS